MSEWVIVAVVGVILLFSAKKLPDMARGLGQSMRIFKHETRGLKEDEQRAQGSPNAIGENAPGRAADAGTSPADPGTSAAGETRPTGTGSTSA